MLKIMGSSIVLLCATYVGMNKYHELYSRKKALTDICDGSIKICNDLRCMCMPLDESFRSSGKFFARAAEIIRKGQLPSEAVRAVCAKEYALKKEDKDCIYRFADGLCADDCQGQIANTQMFIAGMKERISDAEKELNVKGKLFIKGSFLAAAAIILLSL